MDTRMNVQVFREGNTSYFWAVPPNWAWTGSAEHSPAI